MEDKKIKNMKNEIYIKGITRENVNLFVWSYFI